MKKLISILLSAVLLLGSTTGVLGAQVSSDLGETLPESVLSERGSFTVGLDAERYGNTYIASKNVKWGHPETGGSYVLDNALYQVDVDVSFSEDINSDAVFWMDTRCNETSEPVHYAAGVRYQSDLPGAVETAQDYIAGNQTFNADNAKKYADGNSPASNGGIAVVPGKTYRYTWVFSSTSKFVNKISFNLTGLTAGCATVSNATVFPLAGTDAVKYYRATNSKHVFSYLVNENGNNFVRLYGFQNSTEQGATALQVTGVKGMENSLYDVTVKAGSTYHINMNMRMPKGSAYHNAGGTGGFKWDVYETGYTYFKEDFDKLVAATGSEPAGGYMFEVNTTAANENYVAYSDPVNGYSYLYCNEATSTKIRRVCESNHFFLNYTDLASGAVTKSFAGTSSSLAREYKDVFNDWQSADYSFKAFGQSVEEAALLIRDKQKSYNQYERFQLDDNGKWVYQSQYNNVILPAEETCKVAWVLTMYTGDVLDIDDAVFAETADFSIHTVGNGAAATNSNLIYLGDEVTLTATPAKGETFFGWFDADGSLISENAVIQYTVAQNNMTVTARFSQNGVPSSSWAAIANWVQISASNVAPNQGDISTKIDSAQYQFIYAPLSLKQNTKYQFSFAYKGVTPIEWVRVYAQKSGMDPTANSDSGNYKPGNDENGQPYPNLVTSSDIGKVTDDLYWNNGNVLFTTTDETEYYLIIKFAGRTQAPDVDYLANALLTELAPVKIDYNNEAARVVPLDHADFGAAKAGDVLSFTVEAAKTTEISVRYDDEVLLPDENGIYTFTHNGTGVLKIQADNVSAAQQHAVGKGLYGEDLTCYNEKVYSTFAWARDITYQEAVMFYNSADGQKSTEKTLLFPIDDVISLRSADLKTYYIKGVDFDVQDGKLVWLEGGKCPIWTRPLVVPQDTKDEYFDPELLENGMLSQAAYYKTDEKNGLYLIADNYHEQFTVYATYTHSKTWAEFDGSEGYEPSAPIAKGDKLQNFYQKLQSGEAVNVLVYGDSVATGCSSTGANMAYDLFDDDLNVTLRGNGIGIKAPTYFEQITSGMISRYGSGNAVTYYNIARGGKNSTWGADHLKERVEAMNAYYGKTVAPDIIYLQFYGNDTGTGLATYRSAMDSIVSQFEELYPNADIVMFSGKVNNAKCIIYDDFDRQLAMEAVLVEVANAHEHCICVEEFTAWMNIVKSKDYEDYLSNNINHANDWWAMITAQVAVATMQRAEDALMYGDANDDGWRNLKDVVLITRHTLGYEVNANLRAMDTDRNGTVDLKDAAYLAQYIAGYENRPL